MGSAPNWKRLRSVWATVAIGVLGFLILLPFVAGLGYVLASLVLNQEWSLVIAGLFVGVSLASFVRHLAADVRRELGRLR